MMSALLIGTELDSAWPTSLLLLAMVAGLCCTKVEPRGHAPTANGSASHTTRPAPPCTGSTTPAKPNANLAANDWVEAVRLERWPIAASLIDELPETTRNRPDVRYVRARAAIATGDFPRALTLLDGLETQLRLLAGDIGHYRAEAQLHAGQETQSARYFARSRSVKSLTKAAVAWSLAGRPKQARRAIDRAIVLAGKRTDDDVVRARKVRADLAEAANNRAVAVPDLRFVARHAREPQQADLASTRLEQLAPKHRLTSAEHMHRARDWARQGKVNSAFDQVNKAIAAPGGPPSNVDQLLTRARALYGSRDNYATAAQLYEQAAAIRGDHVPQATYFAAKAWSRADDNDRAFALYARLTQKKGSSTWSERAGYYAPRLHRLHGQWAQAEKGYSAYLKRYPHGQFAEQTRYELAMCLLMTGKNAEARRRFAKLARDATGALDVISSRYLAAVAAHKDGNTDESIKIWRSIVSSHPLSWFALASAARLASVEQTPPPPIRPPPSLKLTPLSVKLPDAVRLLRDIGLDRDAEDLLRSTQNAIARTYGDRAGEALCNAYQQLDTGERLYRVGQRNVPVRLVMVAPSIATRWAWNCLYPRPYRKTIARLEQRDKLPSGLLYAVMRQESAFSPSATSPVGAKGLMQLMPKTAEKTARRMSMRLEPKSITSPGVNLELGSRYLSTLMEIFHGSVPLAAGSYNAGPNAVGRWIERAGDVPMDVWVALVPYRETREYIWRVVGNYARYRYIELGEDGIPTLNLRMPSDIRVPFDAY